MESERGKAGIELDEAFQALAFNLNSVSELTLSSQTTTSCRAMDYRFWRPKCRVIDGSGGCGGSSSDDGSASVLSQLMK